MDLTERRLVVGLRRVAGRKAGWKPALRPAGSWKDGSGGASHGSPRHLVLAWAIFVLFGLGVMSALAFPPAPHHLIYGMVRGEMGDPITVTNAEVLLATGAGVQIKTTIIPNLAPGVNYRLSVPMDSGLTADPYKPTALRPTVPFRLSVKIGTSTYLPIEMAGNYQNLGQPAGETRLNLTLGEDSDGDGLPDAWERAIIAMLGGNLTLANIGPGGDSDQDGMSNLDEYFAGTYAFDPEDGFALEIEGFNHGAPILKFLGIRDRTYSLLGSQDMIQWSPVAFRLVGANETASPEYYAADVRTLRIEAPPAGPEAPPFQFFKLMVR